MSWLTLMEKFRRDYQWPLGEMRRATLPPLVSHWKPVVLGSQNGSSNPSTLLQPSKLSTHSNLSVCDWRMPRFRFPRRRLREHPPTDWTHGSLWSATSSRSPVASDFTSSLSCFASDWPKSYRRIKGQSGEPPGRYSSFTLVDYYNQWWVPVNAVTGEVGTGSNMSGKATYQEQAGAFDVLFLHR